MTRKYGHMRNKTYCLKISKKINIAIYRKLLPMMPSMNGTSLNYINFAVAFSKIESPIETNNEGILRMLIADDILPFCFIKNKYFREWALTKMEVTHC